VSVEFDRKTQLKKFAYLLDTEAGSELLDELRTTWDSYKIIGATPEETAYNVGLRDAFKFIEGLQRGDFINE
jgi:hypothetical protein